MRRLALVLVLLVSVAGCQDGSGSAPVQQPGSSVQKQLDDMESTLDSIESELNAG